MDADGQHRVEDAIKIFNLCIKAKADLVIGSRKKKNRITEMILSKLFYLKYKIKDPISGLKIYNVEKLKKINFQGKNLYFVNLVLDFLKKKFKTLSTEIKFNKRFDKPRVGGSFTVNLKIIKIILYCMVR